MIYKPGDIASFDIQTYNQSSELANPSALSIAVFRNDTLDATITPAVTVLEAGVREATFTIPLTYAKGDRVRASVDATCDARRGVKTMFRATLDSKRVGDLNDPTVTAIANATESALLNEGDGTMFQTAIVAAIGNSNLDQVAVVAAVRADLERGGGYLANILGLANLIDTKTENLPDDPATETKQNATLTAIGNIDIPEPDVAAIATAVREELTDELVKIVSVWSKLQEVAEGDAPVIVWPAAQSPAHTVVMTDLARFGVGQKPALQGLNVKMELSVTVGTIANGEFVIPVTVDEEADADGRAFHQLTATPEGCYWQASIEINEEKLILCQFTFTTGLAQLDLAAHVLQAEAA